MSDNKHEIAFVKFPGGFGICGDVYIRSDLIVSIFSRGDKYRVEMTNGNLVDPISAKSVADMKLVVLRQGEAGTAVNIVIGDNGVEEAIHEAITEVLEA